MSDGGQYATRLSLSFLLSLPLSLSLPPPLSPPPPPPLSLARSLWLTVSLEHAGRAEPIGADLPTPSVHGCASPRRSERRRHPAGREQREGRHLAARSTVVLVGAARGERGGDFVFDVCPATSTTDTLQSTVGAHH